MTPLDIILYACAFLVASIPVSIAILFIGVALQLVRKKL